MPQEIQETDFIVLRTTRYGEGKLIVNGLTPSGRLSFIVYGAVGGGKKGGLDFELFRLLHVSTDKRKQCNLEKNLDLLIDRSGVHQPVSQLNHAIAHIAVKYTFPQLFEFLREYGIKHACLRINVEIQLYKHDSCAMQMAQFTIITRLKSFRKLHKI